MQKVKLLGNKFDGFQLTVDGMPFFIKGAGLEFEHLKSLVEAGRNAFRTWRIANSKRDALDILDEAEALGLKVRMGLDVARRRHGFDYSDRAVILAQTGAMMYGMIRLKDHPSLLIWEISTELDRAVAWANRYQTVVDVVSAGNEATVNWTDHLIEPNAVTAYVAFLRSRVSQPITLYENYVPWRDKVTGLAKDLDLIAIHSYPVWEYKTVAETMEYTLENFEAVQSAYPDKEVTITEAGCATASNGRAIPPENIDELFPETHLRELLDWVKERQEFYLCFRSL